MSTSQVNEMGQHITTPQDAEYPQDDGGHAPRGPDDSPRLLRRGRDPLLLAILTTAATLAVGLGLLAAVWSPEPVTAEVPLFIPTVSAFSGLAAASVAFLAFGRYQVLGRPSAFWTALAFSALAVLLGFYVLAWPGMAPDGGGIIAGDPNTAAWIYNLAGATTVVLLFTAAVVRWPRPGRRLAPWGAVVAWLAAITLAGVLSVRSEASLPRLVVGSRFPAVGQIVAILFVLLYASGALVSVRRYRTTGDTLLGYVALFQVTGTFSVAIFFVAQQRYDVWWYLSRLLVAGGLAAALFGLLDEYVGLYQRERERTEALRKSESRLQDLTETLEERVAERTRQLRALAAEITVAEERERRRLADLLHDDLQQTLAAAMFHLDLVCERVPTEEFGAMLHEPMAMLREAIETSRSLSAELSPNLLHDTNLGAALQVLAHRMEQQHGLRVAVEATEPEDAPPLPEDLRLLLYRSVRELLFNIIKHAGVAEASIRVDWPEPHTARLTVADEGQGFDPAEVLNRASGDGGLGLFSIAERLAHIGGSVHIDSAPGRGTRVTLVVSLDPASPPGIRHR